MIYVLEVGDRHYVKIGYCKNKDVSERVKQLQTGCPFEIKVVLVIEGTLRQEKSLHAALNNAFARIRIPTPPNEWYPGRHVVMLGFVDNLKFGFDFGFKFICGFDGNMKRVSPRKPPAEKPNFEWPGFSGKLIRKQRSKKLVKKRNKFVDKKLTSNASAGNSLPIRALNDS